MVLPDNLLCVTGTPEQVAAHNIIDGLGRTEALKLDASDPRAVTAGRVCLCCAGYQTCSTLHEKWVDGTAADAELPRRIDCAAVVGSALLVNVRGRSSQEVGLEPVDLTEGHMLDFDGSMPVLGLGSLSVDERLIYDFIMNGGDVNEILSNMQNPAAISNAPFKLAHDTPGYGQDIGSTSRYHEVIKHLQKQKAPEQTKNGYTPKAVVASKTIKQQQYEMLDAVGTRGACFSSGGLASMSIERGGDNSDLKFICLKCPVFAECGATRITISKIPGVRAALGSGDYQKIRRQIGGSSLIGRISGDPDMLAYVLPAIKNAFMEYQEALDPEIIKTQGKGSKGEPNRYAILRGELASALRVAFESASAKNS